MLRYIIVLLALSSPVLAQVDAVLRDLKSSRLADAVAKLDRISTIADPDARLETAQSLTEQAARFSGTGATALKEKALRHATRLLTASVPRDTQAERHSLRLDASTALDALLAKQPPRAGAEIQRTRARCLTEARDSLIALDRDHTRQAREVDLKLIPLLLELKHTPTLVKVGEAALVGPLSAEEKREVRSAIGQALLRLKKHKEAVPYLADYIAKAPADAEHVMEIVEQLPLSVATSKLEFLKPVLAKNPTANQSKAWTLSLAEAYSTIDATAPKREPGLSILKKNTIYRALPKIWGGASWAPGFRTWRADNTTAGKAYSGRHGISAVLPISGGWKRINSPPAELKRWNNHAICMQRGSQGPVLVIYWFGPDLQYWYGTTARNRGMTGKAARGHSRGGIASLVAEKAYREDAKQRKVRFRTSSPLRFRPRVSGTTVRKQWKLGDQIYDETFFAIGQVTGEVLLRASAADIALLEPEIRWLYQHITTR
ncbi:MAG: hypothetical protein QF412_00315 [Planctomycetota bacterium]|jgi:hypothetical protein|nr:hypothetical protein [Planctomycetota bacterium]